MGRDVARVLALVRIDRASGASQSVSEDAPSLEPDTPHWRANKLSRGTQQSPIAICYGTPRYRNAGINMSYNYHLHSEKCAVSIAFNPAAKRTSPGMVAGATSAMRTVFATDISILPKRAACCIGVEPGRGTRPPLRSEVGFFLYFVAAVLFMQIGESALAFSPGDYPSFTLKIFDQDATIFYRMKIGQGGLATGLTINQRPVADVKPSETENIQARLDRADEVQLNYDPESAGGSVVNLFSNIPAIKPFAVIIFVEFQRTPVVGEIGNQKILSAIEHLSSDTDRSHFDEHGYRQLTYPTFNFVMQRSLYSRPDGRPLFSSGGQFPRKPAFTI